VFKMRADVNRQGSKAAAKECRPSPPFFVANLMHEALARLALTLPLRLLALVDSRRLVLVELV
jgi:hypothetical protein